MQADRFFQTTRGRIVEELRIRKCASAVDLAQVFGLSPNAIRQQLVVLERDGLVVEKSVRRGRTKPTYEFSLTPDAEKLFPQHYDKMLGAVLREIKTQYGHEGVAKGLRRYRKTHGCQSERAHYGFRCGRKVQAAYAGFARGRRDCRV